MKKTIVSKGLSLSTAVLISFLCMQSCAVEEMPQPDPTKPYLHVDIPETGVLSESQLEMLAVAWQRVDEFVYIENDMIILDASAEELNMSEELFSFIKAGIEGQNRLTTRANVPPGDPGAPNPKDPEPIGGGGGDVLEFDFGFGYYQWSTTLSHDEAIGLFHTMQNASTWVGALGSLTSLTAGHLSLISGAYYALTSTQWGGYETEYLNTGNNNGIKVIQITFTASTFPYTSYIITPL